MITTVSGFDWDDANIEKCKKHGLSVKLIEELFSRDIFILGDESHSEIETRYIAIGNASNDRHVFVGFTIRKSGTGLLIRPVTARYMHRREIRKYEKTIAKI
ncbi:MAG: BrnT family toxin [Pyrinomonadaceae bacterium]